MIILSLFDRYHITLSRIIIHNSTAPVGLPFCWIVNERLLEEVDAAFVEVFRFRRQIVRLPRREIRFEVGQRRHA